MNLRQIEVFHAIMTTGSVSDASRLLHVSVPAVSRVLAHAESRLGFPLFERVKGRLHPTLEARQMYLEVDRVYQGVKRVNHLTHELAQRRQSVLRIVSSPSIGQMLIPLAIAYFRSGSPEARVQFECLNHAHLIEQLLNGPVDLGVSLLPVAHPNLESVPIARGRLICIAPVRHRLARCEKVSMEELNGEPIITYPRDTPFGSWIERFYASYDEPLSSITEVGSPQNACALVHAGVGVALVDEFSIQAWPMGEFVARPVLNAEPFIADLVHRRTESLSPAAQAFVHALQSVLLERSLAIPAAESPRQG